MNADEATPKLKRQKKMKPQQISTTQTTTTATAEEAELRALFQSPPIAPPFPASHGSFVPAMPNPFFGYQTWSPMPGVPPNTPMECSPHYWTAQQAGTATAMMMNSSPMMAPMPAMMAQPMPNPYPYKTCQFNRAFCLPREDSQNANANEDEDGKSSSGLALAQNDDVDKDEAGEQVGVEKPAKNAGKQEEVVTCEDGTTLLDLSNKPSSSQSLYNSGGGEMKGKKRAAAGISLEQMQRTAQPPSPLALSGHMFWPTMPMPMPQFSASPAFGSPYYPNWPYSQAQFSPRAYFQPMARGQQNQPFFHPQMFGPVPVPMPTMSPYPSPSSSAKVVIREEDSGEDDGTEPIADAMFGDEKQHMFRVGTPIDFSMAFMKHEPGDGIGTNGTGSQREEHENRPKCVVCGDLAKGKHYGVMACEGCKGFFMRLIKLGNDLKPNFKCVTGKNECEMSRDKRNLCQFCRFQSCLNAGMDREALIKRVEEHRQRAEKGKKLQTGQEHAYKSIELLNVVCPSFKSQQLHRRSVQLGLDGLRLKLNQFLGAVLEGQKIELNEEERGALVERGMAPILVIRHVFLDDLPALREFCSSSGTEAADEAEIGEKLNCLMKKVDSFRKGLSVDVLQPEEQAILSAMALCHCKSAGAKLSEEAVGQLDSLCAHLKGCLHAQMSIRDPSRFNHKAYTAMCRNLETLLAD